MKKLFLLLLASGTALAAAAHCETFFSHAFGNDETLGNPVGKVLWTYEGASDGETMGSNFVVMPDMTLAHNGSTSICFTRVFNSGDRTEWYAPDYVSLRFISGSDAETGNHVTPCVEVIGENGTLTYSFDKAQSNIEAVTTAQSTGVQGNFDTLGKVQTLKIYFDNLADDEILSLEQVQVYSHWYMPKVGKSVRAKSYMYDSAVPGAYFWSDDPAAPIKLDEAGVTYIQAEDYDKSEINGHVAHSPLVAGGGNIYRSLEPSDNSLYIGHQDSGPRYYQWDVNGRRYEPNKGYAIKNCTSQASTWYLYKGEYTDPANKKITMEQAMDGLGTWFEYTVDVLEDCDADLYISAGVHGIPFQTALFYGAEDAPKNVWRKNVDGGYDVIGLNEDYVKKYCFGIRVELDGQPLKSAWNSAPRKMPDDLYDENTKVTLEDLVDIVKNPSKWSTYDDEYVSYSMPIPYVITDHNGTQIPVWDAWVCFYKEDMFRHLVETGEMSEAAAAPYMHGDFCNIHLTKGRHTFKVRSMACLHVIDEMKIKVHDAASVDDIFVSEDDNKIDFTKPCEFFDLQGRKVVNPTSGLFIVRQGNKTAKHFVR